MIGAFGRHPWLGDLLGNTETCDLFGPENTMAAMLKVEAAHARALGATGRVSSEQAEKASKLILAFQPDLARLRASTTKDGVVVPGLVSQLKEKLPDDLRPRFTLG